MILMKLNMMLTYVDKVKISGEGPPESEGGGGVKKIL
jgi:hypothetical protein